MPASRVAVTFRVVALVAVGAFLARCGGCGEDPDFVVNGGGGSGDGGRDGGSDAGRPDSGGGGDQDAAVVLCPQGCPGTQFCSQANQCIDAGSCLLSTDCAE